ncbi:tRNA 2-thiouridine synthesizing protein B [Gammaproteobacteria bacterium]
MLHTVNKSPFERNTLKSCLAHAKPGSAVLLIEDGVYAALADTAASGMVQEAMTQVSVYALGPDLEARGVAKRVIGGIKVIDYAGFVDLAVEHPTTQSWL